MVLLSLSEILAEVKFQSPDFAHVISIELLKLPSVDKLYGEALIDFVIPDNASFHVRLRDEKPEPAEPLSLRSVTLPENIRLLDSPPIISSFPSLN